MQEDGEESKEKRDLMSDKSKMMVQTLGDPLTLQSLNHPGMVFVFASLIGTNFRTWHKAIKIALGANEKLEFIKGTITMPDRNFKQFELWRKCNFIVTFWILNSISKDIVDGFIHIVSAHDLWLKITERFGECNGPTIYQLHRKIVQENIFISVYFTRLKRL
ncbi:hypothetical protein MANES_01G120401v8 [Manihot esculenta]|uniref:Uncharacterized protein n=1 Tax=Manihot esculenta TaxID=3983 RepID=A0ACB7IH86_MANES|nr:hypothetical protein MANES_01G120401v8 [Manihot esculenta]